MPAAKRYTQSQIENFLEGLKSLPAGAPPEPEYKTEEVLKQLEDELRRRYLQDHVSVGAMVAELNERGLKVSAREISKRVKEKKSGRKSRSENAAPAVRRKAREGATVAPPTPRPAAAQGMLNVDRDEDDIA